MKPWLILACALTVGAAAPARAWCEATCGAPASQSRSHCPAHDSTDGTTSLSASVNDECPVVESARLTASARLDVQAVVVRTSLPSLPLRTYVPLSFDRSHTASTVFERCTPLRI